MQTIVDDSKVGTITGTAGLSAIDKCDKDSYYSLYPHFCTTFRSIKQLMYDIKADVYDPSGIVNKTLKAGTFLCLVEYGLNNLYYMNDLNQVPCGLPLNPKKRVTDGNGNPKDANYIFLDLVQLSNGSILLTTIAPAGSRANAPRGGTQILQHIIFPTLELTTQYKLYGGEFTVQADFPARLNSVTSNGKRYLLKNTDTGGGTNGNKFIKTNVYLDNSKQNPDIPLTYLKQLEICVSSIVQSDNSYYYTKGIQKFGDTKDYAIYRLDQNFENSKLNYNKIECSYLINYDNPGQSFKYAVYTSDDKLFQWKPSFFNDLPQIIQLNPIGKAYTADGSRTGIKTVKVVEQIDLDSMIDDNLFKIKNAFNCSMYTVNNSTSLINLSSSALKDKQNYALYTGKVLDRTLKNSSSKTKELTIDTIDYSASGMAISKTIYSVSNYSFPSISSLLFGYNGEGCFTGINSSLPGFYSTTWYKTRGESNTYFINTIAGIKEYWELGLFGTVKVDGKQKKIYPNYNLIAICLYTDPSGSTGFKPMFGKTLPVGSETLIQGCNTKNINDLLIGNEDVTKNSLYYITEDSPIKTWYIYDLKKVVVLSDIISNNNRGYSEIFATVDANLDNICTQDTSSTKYKNSVTDFVNLQDQNVVPIIM
jgi:hypothetical protein